MAGKDGCCGYRLEQDAVMVQRHVSAQRRQVYVLHINIATAVSRELAKIGLVRFSFQGVSAGTDSTGSDADIVFSLS